MRRLSDNVCWVTTTDEAKTLLEANGVWVVEEKQIPHGVQLRGDGGQILNVYETGRTSLQGKDIDRLKDVFSATSSMGSDAPSTATTAPTDVFIVYGHNEVVKNEVERMLRKWRLNPIMLDQIPAEGLTLIEKLERYIQQAPFAVVLATADDVYLTDPDGTQKEFRARQNVVLELGMMLVHLGRAKVAILFEDKVGMKKPSDIDGLEYLSFKKAVTEARVSLAQMMAKQGYSIDIGSL